MANSVQPHKRQPTRLPCPWGSSGKNTGVGCHFLLQCIRVKSESEVAQSRPTLCYPMDCGPPGSSVHGIFQARVLEWGAIAFSASSPRGGSNSPGGTQAGCRRGLAAKLGVREESPDIHPNSARRALLPSDSNKETFV